MTITIIPLAKYLDVPDAKGWAYEHESAVLEVHLMDNQYTLIWTPQLVSVEPLNTYLRNLVAHLTLKYSPTYVLYSLLTKQDAKLIDIPMVYGVDKLTTDEPTQFISIHWSKTMSLYATILDSDNSPLSISWLDGPLYGGIKTEMGLELSYGFFPFSPIQTLLQDSSPWTTDLVVQVLTMLEVELDEISPKDRTS